MVYSPRSSAHHRAGSSSSSASDVSAAPALRQVDPSPISPDIEKHALDMAPAVPAPRREKTLPFDSAGRGLVYYMVRLHQYSTYPPLAFLGAHWCNTALFPLLTTLPRAESLLLLTRPYYQSFPLEHVLLTLPIATHLFTGVYLRLHRRNLALTRYGASSLPLRDRLKYHVKVWPPLSWPAAAGYALVPLLAAHVWTNRAAPWVYEGGSSSVGLGYVAHGFARWPIASTLGYSALVVVGTGHVVWGAWKWWGRKGRSAVAGYAQEKSSTTSRWFVLGMWAVVAGSWLLGGLGVVGRAGRAEGWVGKGFDDLYAKAWH